MRPEGPRDPYAGPESGPESPFPIKMSGPVIKGFGRGSRELGIPTANIPPSGLDAIPDLTTGVYYGFVGLYFTNRQPSRSVHGESATSAPDTKTTTTSTSTTETRSVQTFPAVLSIGYNPFYKNTIRSVEIHILHSFRADFYGSFLNLMILGFIRPEFDYVDVEKLIKDINLDCDVARRSLERPAYAIYEKPAGDASDTSATGEDDEKSEWRRWLTDFAWVENSKEDQENVVREQEQKILAGN